MTSSVHGETLGFSSILARAAQSVPTRDAVVQAGIKRSYASVFDRACRVAQSLHLLGVGKGDRVALWTNNCPEFMEVFFGVPMLGAIVSPVDCWWHWNDALVALETLRPKALFLGAEQAQLIAPHSEELESLGIKQIVCIDMPIPKVSTLLYDDFIRPSKKLTFQSDIEADDPAVILFTSGSTGKSKGTVHTHLSLTATAKTMCIELGFVDGEKTLHFLPMFSSCLEHLIPLTLMRATHVIHPRFDVNRIWHDLEHEQITHFDAVPTTLKRLMTAAPETAPSALRVISYASERMPEQLIKALIEKLPNVELVQFYGMIEHLCLTVLSASDHTRKPGTVGRPMLGARLKLDESQSTEPGVGEIIALSPSMFSHYWEDQAATNSVVSDGWMKTGDLGCFDDDGYLELKGRVKELIKSGGITIIPGEIEAALQTCPDVHDAIVVGLPDTDWGEAVHAFVVLETGTQIDEQGLSEFCKGHLTGYKRPKQIHIVAELPKTGIGKVSRSIVRQQFIDANQESGAL